MDFGTPFLKFRFWATLAIFTVFGFPPGASAAGYALYLPDGTQVAEYNELLPKIDAGDRIDMGDGRQFTVLRRLGHGATTQVFETEDHRALRVPLRKGKKFKVDYRQYLKGFYDSYADLEDSDLPLVHLFRRQSNPDRYLVVELIENAKFNLRDFALKSDKALKLTEGERERAMRALIRLAKATWHYKYLGDMHEGQIVWNDKDWKIADIYVGKINQYTIRNRLAQSPKSHTIFDDMEFLPPEMRKLLRKEAIAERERRFMLTCIHDTVESALTPLSPSMPQAPD